MSGTADLMERADAFFAQGRYNDALRLYCEAEDGPKARIGMGKALRKLNLLERARKVLERDPDDAEAIYELGQVMFDKKELGLAIESFKKAIELDLNMSKAYQSLAVAYRKRRELDLAFESINRAIEIDGNDPDLHFELGELHFVKNEKEQAIAALERALSLKADHHQVMSELAYMYELDEKLDLAADYWRRAYDILPMTRYRKNSFFCRKAVERGDEPPIDATDLYRQAKKFRKAGKDEKALASIDMAIESDPSHTEAYILRAQMKYGEGDYAAAVADSVKAIEYDGRCQQAHQIAGECYRKLSNARLAKKYLGRAMELLPTDDRPHYAMALMSVGKDFDRALEHIDAAIDRFPRSANYYLNRGMIWEQKDELDRARQDYETALSLDPRLENAKKRLHGLGKGTAKPIQEELLEGYR